MRAKIPKEDNRQKKEFQTGNIALFYDRRE